VIGLPSLRDMDGASETRIWLAAEATDMRCGFDRLAEQVRSVISQDPLSGHLFLFRSRRAHLPPSRFGPPSLPDTAAGQLTHNSRRSTRGLAP
jgi:transposase